MTASILILCALLTQSPDERPTRFVMQDGRELAGFVDERDLDKTLFTITLDAPWLDTSDRTATIRKDQIKTSFPEPPVERGMRYDREWKNHGGVQITTTYGETVWVHGEDAELSRRARDLSAAARDAYEASLPEVEIAADPEKAAPASAPDPPFARLWGGHIAVLTIGLGLSALTVWFLLLD
jgi:hypothetical protein